MATLADLLRLLAAGQLPAEIPAACDCRAEVEALRDYLAELARFTGAMAQGDLSASLRCGGSLAGRLKGLHANLRHLTWQTQQVAAGDFNQRVACLGEFSTAFNRMVEALAQTRGALEERNRELATAYEGLKSAHTQLLQQETMASIGQLAAGIAHEINNPTGFILSNLTTLGKYVERLDRFIAIQAEVIAKLATAPGSRPDLPSHVTAERTALKIDQIQADSGDLIAESIAGCTRVKQIVRNLMQFSHLDEAEEQPADINAAIADTLAVIAHELQPKATVITEFGDLPPLLCHVGQLNQVFLNLLRNAVEAIADHGEIRIRTHCDGAAIAVEISDTGCGMAPGVAERVFEPFFTTKGVGQGTGLGLSMAYDIVSKHRGTIGAASRTGHGTTFTVRLPVT